MKELIGKKIIDAEVDGDMVILTFEDGDVFEYYASDGGYSTYELIKGD